MSDVDIDILVADALEGTTHDRPPAEEATATHTDHNGRELRDGDIISVVSQRSTFYAIFTIDPDTGEGTAFRFDHQGGASHYSGWSLNMTDKNCHYDRSHGDNKVTRRSRPGAQGYRGWLEMILIDRVTHG